MRGSAIATAVLLLALAAHIPPSEGQPWLKGKWGGRATGLAIDQSGKLLVTAYPFGDVSGIFRVDPSTGAWALLSDYTNRSQGPPAGLSLAVDSSGGIWVVDARYLFSVDPSSGFRTIASDFSDAKQGLTGGPRAVAAHFLGRVFVVGDHSVDGRGYGALFSVDRSSGARTMISDFHDTLKGREAFSAGAIAIDTSGGVLVTTYVRAVGEVLLRIDPATGTRAILSYLSDESQGPKVSANGPAAIAVDPHGNILITDARAGTGGGGALFRVNPSTGTREWVSDFGNPAQGQTGVYISGLAVDASGNVFVADGGGGSAGRPAVLRVSQFGGARTIVSDLGAGTNLGLYPYAIAVEPVGGLLVMDQSAGSRGFSALWRVDPNTGLRVMVSDFGDPSQGPTGSATSNLVVDGSGKVFVACDLFTPGQGKLRTVLLRVDPTSGERTIVQELSDPPRGPAVRWARALAIDASGTILVADEQGGQPAACGNLGCGAILRIDLTTGALTLLSDFGNSTQGPRGRLPLEMDVDASGDILVLGYDVLGRLGTLFRVDPGTGKRTLLSDFGNATQGPTGISPFNVATDRSGNIWAIGVSTVDNPLGSLRPMLLRVDPQDGTRTLVSDFGPAPAWTSRYGLALDASGNILIADPDRGARARGTVLRIDSSTGLKTVLSDFGLPNPAPAAQIVSSQTSASSSLQRGELPDPLLTSVAIITVMAISLVLILRSRRL